MDEPPVSDPLEFIRRRVAEGQVYWTYHVNMRLQERHITRDVIREATDEMDLAETLMRCHVCGSDMSSRTTDLPFKIGDRAIVIV